MSKLNEMNLSNEATVGTQDFSKENENLYKIARELFRCIADHQNKDDNPELRQYKPDHPAVPPRMWAVGNTS